MAGKKPHAYIFAGANASGKSTFISTLIQCNAIVGTYVNPDKILKEELKLPETSENYLKAFEIGAARREELLQRREDIVVETVYSTEDKVEYSKRLKAAGYHVSMFYTGTENVYINAIYLANRVVRGGHDVPIRKLIDRRDRSFRLLKKSLSIFDCAVFIDNSVPGEHPVIIRSILAGYACYTSNGHDRSANWMGE